MKYGKAILEEYPVLILLICQNLQFLKQLLEANSKRKSIPIDFHKNVKSTAEINMFKALYLKKRKKKKAGVALTNS